MSFARPFFGDLSRFSAAEPARAIRTEIADAAANTRTSYTMSVGDTFNGSVGRSGDSDWVRVNLQPGTYIITLDGRGSGGLADPYLTVRGGNGSVIAYDDDSGNGLNSRVVLNVTQAGSYYLDASAYGTNTGAYALRIASNVVPTFTIDQIAHQLTNGFWESNGSTRRAFDINPGETLNVDLSGLTAAGRNLAVAALTAWTDVSGIRFNANAGAGQPIHIRFDDNNSGAYSTSSVSGGTIYSSFVNVGLDWLQAYGTGFDTYSYQTYIHEIGHALGLGHSGNYNGNAVYGVDNHYANDSWQATIMSYFDQIQNTSVNASFAYVMTAMMADVVAIRDLYGPATLRTGATTYGEGSNAGGSYGVVSRLLATGARDDITFTIVDSAGVDTLNLASDTANQRINLAQGAVSNAYGLTGNISIAQGTIIEHVRAGSGHDTLSGNNANNFMAGNAGNDHMSGGLGNDTMQGGAGRDTMIGGLGNDTYYVDGQDTVTEAANAGWDVVIAGVNHRLGANVEELRLVGTARTGEGNVLNNTLIGNDLANVMHGYAGNDRLAGGRGNDTMTGGGGADVFVFNSGRDVITDFQNNIDTIQVDDALWGNAPRSIAQVLQFASVSGGNIVFNFGNGNTLTVQNMTNIQALSDDLAII